VGSFKLTCVMSYDAQIIFNAKCFSSMKTCGDSLVMLENYDAVLRNVRIFLKRKRRCFLDGSFI
jgi:hypothetical protein